MAVNILSGFGWGVDEENVVQGAGAGAAPEMSSAVSSAPDRIRVTFNQAMDEDSIGRFQNYRVLATVTGDELSIVGVIPVSDTEVDLITSAQLNTLYDLTVTGVVDAWEVAIGSTNTAQFAGTDVSTLYPTVTASTAFYGLESGMQAEVQGDFLPDLSAPTLQNRVPGPSDTDVARAANIVLEIIDVGNGVDASTVVLRIDGAIVWQNDVQQGVTHVITKTPITDGYRYELDPADDFLSFATISVRVVASDLAPISNEIDTTYTFRAIDDEAPYLTAQSPAPGATAVSPITNIEVSVLDDAEGVDDTTVVIVIAGDTAWTGNAIQLGFTGTKSVVSGGYHYDIQSDVAFDPYITVVVEVDADDLAATPNSLGTSYSFETTMDIPPQFVNLSPPENSANVAPDQVIGFDITDNVAVDESTVLIFINSVLAYENSVAKNGFNVQKSAVTFGYHYDVTGPTTWVYGTVIQIASSVRDSLDVLASKTWYLSVIEDEGCFEGPVNAFEDSLLSPFALSATTLKHTETLRQLLLTSLLGIEHPVRAIRTLYLRAHTFDLASVLRQIVPTPTAREQTSRLCYQHSNIDVDVSLRRKPTLLSASLQEILTLGLPPLHHRMLSAHLLDKDPNTTVPLACLLVLLAKTLETNELV